MEDNTVYYGVLMNRSLISSGIYLFRPSCLLEGNIDISGETALFVDNSSHAYYMSTDGESLAHDVTDTVAYVISKVELLAQSSKPSIECAAAEYYDKIESKVHVGYYIESEESLQLASYDLESVYQKLNSGDFNPDIIEYSLDIDNVDDNSKEFINNFANQFGNSDAIVMSVDDLKKIVNQPTLEAMKDELQKLYRNLEKLQGQATGVSNRQENSNVFLDKIKSGNDILEFFEKVYNALLKIEDINELKDVISHLSNWYTELCLEFDERGEYDDVMACKDYLYVLVDTYDNMLKLDNLADIRSEIIKLKDSKNQNMKRLASVYDERKPQPIVEEENHDKKTDNTSSGKIIDINDIEKYLNKKVIGQQEAKLDVIQTIFTNMYIEDPKDKLSCLLVGPTGSGKTLILQQISEYLDIPMQIIDTTQLTMPGYVGANIEDFLSMLIAKADGDIKKAERGIVVFDELDKKGSGNNSDVSGKGVLNTLLPFMDGTTYQVSYKHKVVLFDTSKLTIFATGAFTDVVKEKKQHGYHGGGAGFQVSREEKEDIVYDTLEIEDFEKYGYIPIELLGRFSIISQLSGHTRDSLREILLSESGVLSTFINIFNKFNVQVSWTEGYIDGVIDRALNLGTGARSLKSTVSKSIRQASNIVFKSPEIYSSIILKATTVKDNKDCELIDYQGISQNLRDVLTDEKESVNDEKKYIKRIEGKEE